MHIVLVLVMRLAFGDIEAPSCRKGAFVHEGLSFSSARLRVVLAAVAGLAEGEGHVAVLDHVLDLFPHWRGEWVSKIKTRMMEYKQPQSLLTREDKQDDPVHNEDRPEDGHVKNAEPAAQERDANGARGRVPELELGQPADERPELLVLLGRQAASRAVLHLVVEGLVGRVELGRQEGEEQVEQVDAQTVGDWVC